MKRVLKHSVNLLTGAGAGAATLSLVYAFQSQPRFAWLLMVIATIIDAVDGTVVRVLNLKGCVPEYDGDRLDEYADLITYVVAPVGFAWATGVLPVSFPGLFTGFVICLVSTLQFAHREAKTEIAFRGWPSYWNVIVFYAWAFELSPRWTILICLGLSACVFFPISFVYPSQFPRLRPLTVSLGVLWTGLILFYLFRESAPEYVLRLSLLYPAYYLTLSFVYHDRLQADAPGPE